MAVMRLLDVQSPIEAAAIEAEALLKSGDFEASARRWKELCVLFLGCLTVRPKISAAFHRQIIADEEKRMERFRKQKGDDI